MRSLLLPDLYAKSIAKLSSKIDELTENQSTLRHLEADGHSTPAATAPAIGSAIADGKSDRRSSRAHASAPPRLT